jgi:hypothetical protein
MAAISSEEKVPELESDYLPPIAFLLLSIMVLPAHSGPRSLIQFRDH